MRTLTLFEHTTHPFEWTTEHLTSLAKFEATYSSAPVILTVVKGQRVIRAMNYVGVVQLGETMIHILPKLDRDHNMPAVTRNLLYLLSVAYELPFIDPQFTDFDNLPEADWYEILIFIFARELRRRWLRGAVRDYTTVRDVMPFVRGRVDIAAQTRHPTRLHQLALQYDEFQLDTPLNRVFRYVVEQLWRRTQQRRNREMLSDLRVWLDEVTLLPTLSARDVAPTLIHRLNKHFAPLVRLAQLFLGGQSITLAAGEYAVYALLFDMNRLFEQFVGKLLRDIQPGLPSPLASAQLVAQGHGDTCYLLYDARGRPSFRLKPDFAFRDGQQYRLILDAKYKVLESSNEAAASDLYQMMAYSARMSCAEVVLLYPQSTVTELWEQFRVPQVEMRITMGTVNLQRELYKQREEAALKAELLSKLSAIFSTELKTT